MAPKPWEGDDHDQTRDAKETDRLLPENDCEKASGKASAAPESSGFDFTFGLEKFLVDLSDHFGYKLLWLLFAAQFLIKGFLNSFVGAATPYLFKIYALPAAQTQIYSGVIQLPWAMKPVIGLVTDIFPIRGYNKSPYMLFSAILGVLACMVVGFSQGTSMPIICVVMCLFAVQLQGSTTDLLSEAKYAEKMRTSPSHGPALMTYVWFGMQVGGLAAVLGSGAIIGKYGARAIYVVAAIPAASVLVPLMLNYMEETPLSNEAVQIARARFMAQKEACILCLVMFAGTVVLAFVGLTSSPEVTASVAIGIAVLITICFSVMLSPVLAKFNVFGIIQSSMGLSLGGATFYFYTDTPEQYPDGPHFTPFFFNSVMGVTSALFSLVGIYLYQRYMSTWKYRNIIVLTSVAYSIICLPDIIMFKRWNVQWGIPDHVFILGASVMEQIVYQWQWMPLVVILSYLCPKGMEATMYALLAGSFNLGSVIASNCGAVVLNWLDVKPRGLPGEGKQFDNLWLAVLISTIMPALTVASLFFLIPDARQNENILDADEDSATTGSLWRRWTGQD